MSGRRFVALLSVTVLSLAAGAGCSKPVDLKQAVQVTDAAGGWFDVGVQNGMNKLVPSVTFKLKKTAADVKLSSLSLNLTFVFIDTQEHADDVFVQNVPFEGPETAPIVVRSQWCFTGTPPQTRAEMLKNSHFRDMEVQIFAKQSSAQWVELQRVKIARQLLTE
jgi:hypothetical protein